MRRALLMVAFGLFATACSENGPPGDNSIDMIEVPPEPVPSHQSAPKVLCDVIGERITEEECEDVRALRQDVRAGAAALDVPNPMTRGQNAQVTLVIDRRPLGRIRALDAADDGPKGAEGSDNGTSARRDAASNAVDTAPDQSNAVQADGAVDTTDMDPDDEQMPTPKQAIEQLPGQDYGFRSSVGRYMRASLAGQGFRIKLISPQDPVQEIAAGGQGTWIWEVTPLEGGNRSLTVTTEAVAKINGRTVKLGDGQESKAVTVEVRAVDTVKDVLTELPNWLKLISGALVAAAAVAAAWWQLRKSMRGTAQD